MKKKSNEFMRKMFAMFLIVLLSMSSLGTGAFAAEEADETVVMEEVVETLITDEVTETVVAEEIDETIATEEIEETIAVEEVNETVTTDVVVNALASGDDTIKILMVGNSLTRYNNVADKLVQLFAYAGKQVTVDTRTQMGASLIDQAEILATSTREAIVYGDYDYIVLQEKSSGFTEDLLRQGVGAFEPWIQEAESHPQLVLYMPWANEDVFKSMQTTFTNAYVKVAKDYGAILAWNT